MGVRQVKRTSVLDWMFLWESEEATDDRYYQNFELFLRSKEPYNYIKSLRKERGISSVTINRMLAGYRAILQEKDVRFKEVHRVCIETGIRYDVGDPAFKDVERGVGLAALKKKCESKWNDLQRYVDSRISVSDVQKILKKFKQSQSWLYALCCYILTDKIIHPEERCRVSLQSDRVVLEVFPEATKRDIEESLKRVWSFQKRLPGHHLRNKRRRKDMGKSLEGIEGYYEYRETPSGEDVSEVLGEKVDEREILKLEVIQRYSGKKDLSPTDVKRVWNAIRQNCRRMKKYI